MVKLIGVQLCCRILERRASTGVFLLVLKPMFKKHGKAGSCRVVLFSLCFVNFSNKEHNLKDGRQHDRTLLGHFYGNKCGCLA